MSIRSTKTLVEEFSIEASSNDVLRALSLLHSVPVPSNAVIRFHQRRGPDGEDLRDDFVTVQWKTETDVQEDEDGE